MSLELRRRRDLGRILDDSFAVYRAHWRTLMAVSAAVVVPVHLLVFGVGLGWLWSGYPKADQTAGVGDAGQQLAGLAAQLLVVTPLVTAMTVHVVRAAAAGARRPGARAAIAAGLDAFAPLFFAMVLVAAGVGAGLLLLIVPGVVLAVRLVVVPQAVVIESLRGTDALRRSLELTRGRGWFAFLVLLVANLLVGVVSAIVLLPLEYAAEAADAQALSLLGQAVGAIFSIPLMAVAYTLLYYALIVEEEGVGAAAPPAAAPPGAAPPPPDPAPATFGDGFAPPTPPDRGPERPS